MFVIFKTVLHQYNNICLNSSFLFWIQVPHLNLFLSCFSRMKFKEWDNIKILFNQKLKSVLIHLGMIKYIWFLINWLSSLNTGNSIYYYQNQVMYLSDATIQTNIRTRLVIYFYISWSHIWFGLTFNIIKKLVYLLRVKFIICICLIFGFLWINFYAFWSCNVSMRRGVTSLTPSWHHFPG